MISGKTIFISPIDWGLGHASRCVPVIRELKVNNKIIIGVTKKNDFFFREYFPDLEQILISSYNISYSKAIPLWLKLFLQWPSIHSVIKKEKRELEKIISRFNIDTVISDNRFGLWSKKIKSIFITHQLKLKAPVLGGFANMLNRKYIHCFDEVWVPDYEEKEKRLSGELAEPFEIKLPIKYIGPKSALDFSMVKQAGEKQYDYLFLLSGPEPQRSILEKLVFEQTNKIKGRLAIIRGSKEAPLIHTRKADVFDLVTGQKLSELIVNSETVICRSGYSTLMDLHMLDKRKLVLIPTPGQSEQEYLAELWHEKFGARVLAQNKFSEEF